MDVFETILAIYVFILLAFEARYQSQREIDAEKKDRPLL